MTELTWTASDLDSAQSESGVVHESVTNTDHNSASVLKQGYQINTPYKSANTWVYTPMHEDSGSTVNDFSGNNNNGSITGATLGQTAALGTTGSKTDGVDDYIDYGTAINNSWSASRDFSVVYWYKWPGSTDGDTSGFDMGFWGDADGGNNYRGIRLDDSKNHGAGEARFAIRRGDGNEISVYTSGLNFDSGNWMQIACTYDGSADASGMNVYANATNVTGGTENNQSMTTSDSIDGTNWYVGRRPDGNYSQGIWNDYRILTTELTASEVQALYDVVNTNGTLTTASKTA